MMSINEFKITSIIIFWLLLIFAPVTYGQMGGMSMYKSAEIDGCTDFHCLKCSDRNACSRGESCDMPNCGHKHGAVLCHGGILFYLRESRGFTDAYGNASSVARAENVANKLNKLMGMMGNHANCYFTVLDENGNELSSNNQTPTIWFTMIGGGHRNKVISVTSGDLWGYKYRANLPDLSGMAMPANRVTKKMVAQWWAYTLKDHFKMMVLNEKPYLTTYTKCGKVLLKIWEQAKKLKPNGKIPMSTWTEVVENLSSDDKGHLYLAAQIVPKNFDPNGR